MRDLTRSQGFSILVIPGQQPKDNIVVGKHNALFVSENATQMPTFISPESSILQGLITYRESLVNSLLQCGDILGSTAMSNGSSSGVALSYRFMGTKDSLLTTAMVAEHYETKIIEMFGAYMNQEFEYEVEYNENYSPSFLESQAKLTTIENLLALNINDTVNRTLEKGIVDIMATFIELTDEEVGMLKQSIVEDASEIYEEDNDETYDALQEDSI
jgi:hypothetical protein